MGRHMDYSARLVMRLVTYVGVGGHLHLLRKTIGFPPRFQPSSLFLLVDAFRSESRLLSLSPTPFMLVTDIVTWFVSLRPARVELRLL